MLSCIWTTSNKSERLMHLVGWFIWMYDDARTYKPLIYSSTCFGHSLAHHQELIDCSSRLCTKAATAVYKLLMMGKRMPETCWAVFERRAINLRDWCIWLVDLFECMMMHGLTNPKYVIFHIRTCQHLKFVKFISVDTRYWLLNMEKKLVTWSNIRSVCYRRRINTWHEL